MIYEFSEIQLAGVILPIEGTAFFGHDPREKRRHMPTITLRGYQPGSARPIDASLLLGATNANGWSAPLNYAIREYLMTVHLEGICAQWDDEREGRREAVAGQVHQERIAAYEAA